MESTREIMMEYFNSEHSDVSMMARVPICVVYDLENDRIKRGRVYFEMPILMQQLGVS